MKIRVLVNANPWVNSSAHSNRQLSLINGLISEGQNVRMTIYGPCKNKEEIEKFRDDSERNKEFINYFLPIVVNSYFGIRFYHYVGQYLAQSIIQRLIISDCFNDDVVWLDYSIFSLKIARKLKKKYPDIKLFVEQNEFLDIHLYNRGNFIQRLEGNRRKNLFEKEVFPILDGLALMTNTLFNHYQNFPEPHPEMLHLPMTVDLDRFCQSPPSQKGFQKPYVAYVGVMNDAKDGVKTLLESFLKISKEFSEHKLYLVGPWNYDTPSHLRFIQEKQLENRVFWMKEYPRERIPAIICNADLLVLPRPDSKQAQGGFPTKLGEYLASGSPVCATTVGEIPDYLKDNESVFFAEPGSVEAFALAMKRALIDPENAKRVGLNGKKVAQIEFNKDIQAKKLYQFLLDLKKKEK